MVEVIGLGAQLNVKMSLKGIDLVYPVVQARNLFVKMVKFSWGFPGIKIGCGNLLCSLANNPKLRKCDSMQC